MANTVKDFKLTFSENGAIIGTLWIAASDSVSAENVGKRIAGKNVSVSASLK